MQNKSQSVEMTFADAIRDATDVCLERDPNVFVMGLGVDDPKGIFGTTTGLHLKYGSKRVFDTPVSENALTGIAIGAASSGLRPVLTHQRIDFALLSLDQIINNAAKWHYMSAGQLIAPITIRMIIGRGWGQGPQHSQSLQALFSHIPGLKVVMPSTPYDAKGLMIAAIEDNNPVIFLEHRWLHNIKGQVPTGYYREELGKAKVVREGTDYTIISDSYMTFEAYRAAEVLVEKGINVEIVDLRTVSPLDKNTILKSVKKTQHALIADTGHLSFGVSAEVSALITENLFGTLKGPPLRIASPDAPAPCAPSLAKYYYPRSHDIANMILKSLGRENTNEAKEVVEKLIQIESKTPVDVPDLSFSGPF